MMQRRREGLEGSTEEGNDLKDAEKKGDEKDESTIENKQRENKPKRTHNNI